MALINAMAFGAALLWCMLSWAPHPPSLKKEHDEMDSGGPRSQSGGELDQIAKVRPRTSRNVQTKEVLPARWLYITQDGRLHVDRLCPQYLKSHQDSQSRISKKGSGAGGNTNTVSELLQDHEKDKSESGSQMMTIGVRWWNIQETVSTMASHPYIVPCDLCGRLFITAHQ